MGFGEAGRKYKRGSDRSGEPSRALRKFTTAGLEKKNPPEGSQVWPHYVRKKKRSDGLGRGNSEKGT